MPQPFSVAECRTVTGNFVGQKLTRTLVLSLTLLISACGGGGGDSGASDSTVPATRSLAGQWVGSNCTPVQENVNTRNDVSFTDSQVTQSLVTFINDVGCTSNSSFTVHIVGSYVADNGSVQLPDGTAQHIDIRFSNAFVTATDSLTSTLEANGTSLQASLSAQGINDVNNVPLSQLLQSNEFYTVYRVDNNTLAMGIDGAGGTTPEQRITVLDTTWIRNSPAPTADTVSTTGSLPVDPQTGLPTSGSDACDQILTEDISFPTRLVNTSAICDYRLTGRIEVNSDLIIEPGVAIRADANAEIVIDGGSIIADGTAENPIVMDGNAHVPGYWEGIHFNRGRDSVFDHFHLVDAGQLCTIIFCEDTGFYLDEVRVSFTNSSVSNSDVEGMAITEDVEIVQFANNRFLRNRLAGLSVHPEVVRDLDVNSDYGGGAFPNGIPMVEIFAAGHSRGLVYQWKKLSAPYFIQRFNPDGGLWKIDPGVEIVMGEDATIRIEDNAVVEAIGTAANPIVIRGNNPNPGYWNGIDLSGSENDNIFQYVQITGFGSTGSLLSTRAAFSVSFDSRLILDNVTISNGIGDGVRCNADGFVRFISNVNISGITGNLVDPDCRPF